MSELVYNQESLSAPRLFGMDKNHILREVQFQNGDRLLRRFIEQTKHQYELRYNSLGLVDDTILLVRNCQFDNTGVFKEFYNRLAGIFRYQFGDTQLELLFDGSSHYDKYSADWENFFNKCIINLLSTRLFIRAALEIIVFNVENRQRSLALSRMNQVINQEYQVKIYKNKGILSTLSA